MQCHLKDARLAGTPGTLDPHDDRPVRGRVIDKVREGAGGITAMQLQSANPIRRREDDRFGRWGFACALADLVDNPAGR
jgi:hypothetical protein